jgi:hypothetical protein
MKPTEIFSPEQSRPSNAYLVNELRKGILLARAGLSAHNRHHTPFIAVLVWGGSIQDTHKKHRRGTINVMFFSQSHTPKLTKLIIMVHTNEKS